MIHREESPWKTPKRYYHSLIINNQQKGSFSVGTAKFWYEMIYLKFCKIHNRKIKLMNNLLCTNCPTARVVIPFFIKLLNWIRFSDVLMWKERLFQTFDRYTFKLFAPKVTWFHSRDSRFNLYCSLTNLLFSVTLRILFINSGFSLSLVLYISTYKFLNLFTLIFIFLDFSNKPS